MEVSNLGIALRKRHSSSDQGNISEVAMGPNLAQAQQRPSSIRSTKRLNKTYLRVVIWRFVTVTSSHKVTKLFSISCPGVRLGN